MTPQERQLIDDLFGRLSKLEGTPRDAEAQAAIADSQQRAPNALYALVQTVLVQDEALKRANARIQELEGGEQAQPQGGGFLDTMRDALFGGGSAGTRTSVPAAGQTGGPARWNTGGASGAPQQQYAPQGSPQQGYPQQGYQQQGYPQQGGGGQPPAGGGGGSFLGTAAAAAAGVVGGSLLLGSIRGMMGGGQHQSFGDSSAFGGGGNNSPWSSQPNSDLARDAGIGDIGSRHTASADDGGSDRAGFFDQASNESSDSMDFDGDDTSGGGGGDSDYA